MILFKEDWKKYPNAIADTNTSNKSFLILAAKYKKMGVENYVMILALHNPKLVGVDPYDPNLTNEQKIMITKEVQENPWYFFREVLRAPAKAGVNHPRFKANRFNIALIWLFFNHIPLMGIAPRQTGKSFGTFSLTRGLLNYWTFNTQINLLTKDSKLRASSVESIKNIEKILPKFLRLTTNKDLNNTEKITVKLLGNEYITHIGRAAEADARNVARGLTSPIFHVDEIAFISNIDIILPAALAAGGAARDEAKRNGTPYGTIFTTTAGRKDTKSGKFAYNLYMGGTHWTEEFFNLKDQKELANVVEKQSRGPNPLVILEFNHRQLGYTDEWLITKMNEAMVVDELDKLTDFLNIWVSGTEQSAVPQYILDKVVESKREPDYTEIFDTGYALRWYIPEDKLKKYENEHIVIGVDTSDAIGQDGIGLYIRDIKTGRTLAVGDYNETNLMLFTEFLFDVMLKYKKSILIMERRSSASAILDMLIRLMLNKNIDPFKRIFNWVVNDANINVNRFSQIDVPMGMRDRHIYDTLKKYFGFGTSGSGRTSRTNLYKSLTVDLKYTGKYTYDKKLISQISSLTIKNGRIDHSDNEHDDLVIAKLLTWWFVTNATNITFYGIDNITPLSGLDLTESMDKKDLEKEKHIAVQKKLRMVIEKLFENLQNETNEYKKRLITMKIKHYSKHLDSKYGVGLNINQRLEELKVTG